MRKVALTLITIGAALVLAGTAQAAEPVQERAMNTALMRAKKVGTVESVAVVPTTLGRAQVAAAATAPPGALGAPSNPVHVVTVKGHFVDYMASVPPSDPFPSGTEMAFTVEDSTGFVLIEHVGGKKLSTATAARTTTAARGRAKIASLHRGPRAHAAWGQSYPTGQPCSQGYHCYSYGEWYMPATGGRVQGTSAVVHSTAMIVPGWASGDFVNQEEWTVFPYKYGTWLESGTKAGAYMDCCSLHPFWEESVYESFTTGTAPWSFCCEYKYDSIAVGNGDWYMYWDNAFLGGFGGLDTYSEQVQAGMEVAANTKPYASGEIDTAVEWTTGAWHSWSTETYRRADPGLCWSRARGIIGSMNVGTC
jgi:hypothetical protein